MCPMRANLKHWSGFMSKDPRVVKEELIQIYPKKLRQKRAEQIVVTEHREDGSVPEIKSNVRTSPGIITQRGCTYAGCKGVVIRAHSRHSQPCAWPHRVQFLRMADAAQSDAHPIGQRAELHQLLPVHRHAGRKHCLRRREEAEGRGKRGLSSSFIPRRSRFSPPARSD